MFIIGYLESCEKVKKTKIFHYTEREREKKAYCNANIKRQMALYITPIILLRVVNYIFLEQM